MSALRKVFRHSSLYAVFQGLGLAVSFVSFPIMTRIFTVEEYGNFALVNAVLSILVALAKCGLATAFVRMYPECENERKKAILYSTTSMAIILNFVLVICAYLIIIFSLETVIGQYMLGILVVAGFLIFSRSLRSLFDGLFRAQEKPVTVGIIGLVYRTGSLVTGIGACLLVIGGLYGYLVGVLLFETCMTIALLYFIAKQKRFNFGGISLRAFKSLYKIGIPLLIFEASYLVNDYSDRFLVQYFTGSAQLGIYSAAYNLSLYVKMLLVSPIWLAVYPIYTKLWEAEGDEKLQISL